MIFGKIEYLNLLPFHIFLKRYLRNSSEKKAWTLKGSVPSKINREFKAKRVDAAVISSIKSRRYRCSDFGIVADGEVQSVLLIPGEPKRDVESDTSNQLANVLELKGEIIIGDKALRFWVKDPSGAIDLASAWKEKERLPFVFARLCAHPKYRYRIERMTKIFFRSPPKVPYRVLCSEAKKHGITVKQLQNYLDKIYYQLKWREKRALKRFISLVVTKIKKQ
jgi:chorismate dehydratase